MSVFKLPRQWRLVVILAATMAATALALTTYGVLASELLREMGIERWQLGILATTGTLGAATFSTRLGKWVDSVGGRRATVITLMLSGTALFCVGIAPEFALMVGAAFLNGIGAAISHPATNKLVSVSVEPGRRGIIMGVKQSGIQISIFLGGWLLPVFTAWWGWRWAVIAFAAAPLSLAVATMQRDPPGVRASDGGNRAKDPGMTVAETPIGRLPGLVHRVAAYGFLMGIGVVVIIVYLPLYAEEVLGMSRGEAGLVLALTGPVGMAARIGWARVAEGRIGMVRSLMLIACMGTLSGFVLAFSDRFGTWTIWTAALVIGLSVFCWTSVGMLAVIEVLPSSLAGRGSGVVFFGFSTGIGLGAPLFGLSVDILGVYSPGWWAITLLFAVAGLILYPVRRVIRDPSEDL